MKQTFIKKLAGALACCLLTGSLFGASPAFTVRAQEAAPDALVTDEVTTESSETQLPDETSEELIESSEELCSAEVTLESTTYATTTYTLTVNGGLGSGRYPAGISVSITADDAESGQQFDQWVIVSGDIILDDAASDITYFTMPANDVEITATYKHAHDISSEWSSDETSHWHGCECGYKVDEATHTESNWITDVDPTDTTAGQKHTECLYCGCTMQTSDSYLALEIVTQSESPIAYIGESVTLSVEVTGTAPSYQWQCMKASDNSYMDIENATEKNYTIDTVSLWDHENYYRCIITNPSGEIRSSAIKLVVMDGRIIRMLNLNANGSICGITNPIVPTNRLSLWQGTKVYFGSFDADTNNSAEPILFRVLDAATTRYGGNSAFLDCDMSVCNQALTYDDELATKSCDFLKSSIRTWLNSTSDGDFLESFTLAERNSIMFSNTPKNFYSPLEDIKVFIPTTGEVATDAYGYYPDSYNPYISGDKTAVSRVKYDAFAQPTSYWTRSTENYTGGWYSTDAMYISPQGELREINIPTTAQLGVSPALNLSLDSVLFAGTCDMDKTAPLSAVGLAPESNNVWTLTLKDITKTVDIQDDSVASLDAETGLVTVPYVYYGNGINQISVMITSAPRTEETAEILYYGKLETENSFDTATGSGIGTFTLPTDLPEGYAIYLLAEEIREGNYTDSASEPYTLHLAYAPTLPETGDDGATLNGIHQAADSNYYYYVEGIVDTSVNGLIYHDANGKWYYFENGKLISTKYDIVEFGEAKYFVANGCLQNDASNSGLQLIGDNFYYLAYGQLQEFYTGLAFYDGQWFYIENGVLAIDFSGLQDYDGSKFLISYGQIQNSYTGLYYDATSGNWYYIVNGQVQTFYTGLVLYDGAWFYLENGRLASEFTGTVEYDGAQFEVYCGQVITG